MILTVGTDEGLREQVARSLRETKWATTVGVVRTVGEAEEVLRSASPPRVVVVGRSIGVDGAADVAAAAAALRQPPLVLLVGTPTTALLRQAMRAGVRDVLPVGFGPDDIVATLREAGVSGGGPEPVPGLTVAVFSTKGGVGTSVVASNLAVLLAARTGAATTLVDLDLASADQSIMHGCSPKWTIQDLADSTVGLDAESLQQVLVEVDGSGSRLLPGPVDPALAETITAADVGAVIAAVRAQAPIAVLDTASAFDDRTLTALDTADVTVLVSSLDVASLRSLSVSLQTLERLGIDPARVLLALVRVDSKSGLVVADVERAIDRTIDVGVPSTRAVPRSVNEGVPLAVSAPKSPVVSALGDLVELLVARLPEELRSAEEPSTRSVGRFRIGRSRSERDATEATPRSTPAPPSTGVPTTAGGPSAPAAPAAPTAPAATDADDTPAVEAETSTTSNVRPIRVRQDTESSSSRGRRRVARRTTEASDDDQAVDEPEPAPDPASEPEPEPDAGPTIRAVPSLTDLPPPTLVGDDEDDQPRRRRRR